jgi:recombination protein RecR
MGGGPSEIGLDKLEKRLSEKNIKELILATNTTIEGEATAHYIKDVASKNNINVSRLAFGLPLNGEIGFLDNETISHAFNERKIL